MKDILTKRSIKHIGTGEIIYRACDHREFILNSGQKEVSNWIKCIVDTSQFPMSAVGFDFLNKLSR